MISSGASTPSSISLSCARTAPARTRATWPSAATSTWPTSSTSSRWRRACGGSSSPARITPPTSTRARCANGRLDLIAPDAPRPLADNFYGWAKEAYEHLGFVYATGTLGRPLEVVQIRIGAPRDLAITSFVDERGADPLTLHRDLGMWISPRDLAQLFARSIDTPDIADEYGVPFQVFYGISGNTRSAWSIANARRVIGYAPAGRLRGRLRRRDPPPHPRPRPRRDGGG